MVDGGSLPIHLIISLDRPLLDIGLEKNLWLSIPRWPDLLVSGLCQVVLLCAVLLLRQSALTTPKGVVTLRIINPSLHGDYVNMLKLYLSLSFYMSVPSFRDMGVMFVYV